MMQQNLPFLKTGCFLRKEMRYCTEIVLDKQEKTQALCTTLLALPQVDVLGTQIFVSERDEHYGIKYVLEIAEVDEGHLVLTNLNRTLSFLMNAIMQDNMLDIHELSMHKAVQLPPVICANDLKFELITKNFQPHLLIIHPIFKVEQNNEAYFPQEKASWVFDHLIDAISYRRGGQRATMIFYVLNTGIKTIRPSLDPQDDYGKILMEAIKSGVEVITAKLDIQDHRVISITFDDLFSYDV
jgi:sugar fermentation stimulation protein A